MTWRGAIRAISAELRRQEREAARRARAAEKEFKAELKLAQQELAAAEVELFESHIDVLTSMHRECVDPIDWTTLVDQPLPPPPSEPPPIERLLSEEARHALEVHSRSFFGRLFGSKRRHDLEHALAEALEVEQQNELWTQKQHQARLTEHARAVIDVLEMHELAACVLAGNLEAQSDVVRDSGCLHEIATSLGQTQFDLTLNDQRATLVLHVKEDEVVPSEQLSLTQKGSVSRKKLPATRRMEIYEDYVCGSALRAAREIMAVIPTPAVLIHVESERVDRSTGHLARCVILSVLVPRGITSRVDWTRVDASELVTKLHHNMKLKRGKGFEPVQELTFTES
jgi:hypothetical protein